MERLDIASQACYERAIKKLCLNQREAPEEEFFSGLHRLVSMSNQMKGARLTPALARAISNTLIQRGCKRFGEAGLELPHMEQVSLLALLKKASGGEVSSRQVRNILYAVVLAKCDPTKVKHSQHPSLGSARFSQVLGRAHELAIEVEGARLPQHVTAGS